MPKIQITDSKGLVQSTGTGVEVGGAVLAKNGLSAGLMGLNPTWNENFGGAALQAAGGGVAATTLDVLTPASVMVRLALSLRQIAQQPEAVSAAQAAEIFGVAAGVAGSDVSLTGAAITTDLIPPTLSVNRITGDLAATLDLNDSATDLADAGDQSLIIFTGNKIAASQVLNISVHDNNELDAQSCEFFTTTASGTLKVEREAATTDGHDDIILTESSAAESTILAGSFIYFHAGAAADTMSVKACLLTSGGKIVITSANAN